MNKQVFLKKLQAELSGLPEGDIAERLAFYSESIEDRMEDGLSEEEAVAGMGAAEEIAAQIRGELQLPAGETEHRGRRLQGWEILLLVLGFPLWFPLLVSVFAVVLSLVITLWALVIGFAAVVFSLGVTAIAAPVALVAGWFQGSPLMVAGYALIAGGLCLLGVLALPPLCGAMARLCRAIGRGVKSIFIKKER